MSIPGLGIPGLGQLPTTQPVPSATRTIILQPHWEWRFEVPHGNSISLKLIQGRAERDGNELAPKHTYKLTGTKSKILTLFGATLEIEGVCEEYVAEYAQDNPAVSHVNLHFELDERRAKTKATGKHGPRVLVCGPPNSGKTTLCKTLVAYAVKMGAQPMLVNTDPAYGMLSLPGTLSAAVFASLMDVEQPEGGIGVGSSPSSGPSAVPVKLPLVYYYGKKKVDEDTHFWEHLVKRLAACAKARMTGDDAVRSAGMIIDSPPLTAGQAGTDLLAHVVKAFDADIVVVVGSPRIHTDLQRRFAQERTSTGQPIEVTVIEKSNGVVDRDDHFMQLSREASIKEYFFGDAKRSLSPFTQSVGFKDLVIYTTPEDDPDEGLIPVGASVDMSNCVLTVMNASLSDTPEQIRRAAVVGFLYVAEVDSDRQRLKVLSAMSGALGGRPLVWGGWPEPSISLLS